MLGLALRQQQLLLNGVLQRLSVQSESRAAMRCACVRARLRDVMVVIESRRRTYQGQLYLQETHKKRNRVQPNKLVIARETPRTVLCGSTKRSAFWGQLHTICFASYQNARKFTPNPDLAEPGITRWPLQGALQTTRALQKWRDR